MNVSHEMEAARPDLACLRQEVEKLADTFLAGEGKEKFSVREMVALIRVVVDRSPRELRGLMYPFLRS